MDQQTSQNSCKKYLKKTSLQSLLESLFSPQTEFNIRVGITRSYPAESLQ